MVMDAAAKQAGVSAFLYFYFVRLFLTLYALPILTGFVMQAFLGALAYKEAKRGMLTSGNDVQADHPAGAVTGGLIGDGTSSLLDDGIAAAAAPADEEVTREKRPRDSFDGCDIGADEAEKG